MSSIYVAPGPRQLNNLRTSYEDLCKYVLQRRFNHVMLGAMIATWLLLGISSWEYVGDLLNVLRPTVILWSIIACATGVIPPLVLQKISLTPRRVGYPTLGAQIHALGTQAHTWRTILVYQLSAIAITTSFVFMAPSSTRISVFRSTTLYPWHLNERFLFLMWSNQLLGVVYSFGCLVAQSWAVSWPVHKPKDVPYIYFRRYWNQVYSSIVAPTLCTSFLFLATYLWFRTRIFGMLLYVAKPFVHNFVRSKMWGFSFGIVVRLVVLNLSTTVLWSGTEHFLACYASQPVSVSHYASNQLDCLISGVTSRTNGGYFQHFAIHELSEISQDPKSSSRRKAIFSDLRNPHSASAWAVICRELLLVLGKDYQTLLARGKPQPAAPPAPTPSPLPPLPPKAAPLPPVTPSKLKKAEYAALQRTPTDKFLDGVQVGLDVADSALSHVPQAIEFGRKSVSGLSRSLSNKFGGAPLSTEPVPSETTRTGTLLMSPSALGSSLVGKAKEASSSPINAIVSRIPSPVSAVYGATLSLVRGFYQGFKEETVERKLGATLPDPSLDTWVVTALANLTAASFVEDPYGMVQRDIPKILEALLLVRQALEEYRSEMKSEEVDDYLVQLQTAVGGALHTIDSVFHDRLSAFRFPPRIAQLLQKMMDTN